MKINQFNFAKAQRSFLNYKFDLCYRMVVSFRLLRSLQVIKYP